MHIATVVAEIPGVKPAFGIPDAWTWSPAPGLVFAGALSPDGERLFRLNTRDSFDEELVRAVFVFAREHSTELLSDGRPFVPVSGFGHPGTTFDTVTGVPPMVHSYHEREHPALRDSSYIVFPAYHQEFSGVETSDEAWWRFKRMLRTAELGRSPSPYLKMRYENTKTRSGSEGDQRGFTTVDVLNRELRLLEGAAGSFVEFENRRLQVWSVRWDGTWTVSGEEGERQFEIEDLIAWAGQVV